MLAAMGFRKEWAAPLGPTRFLSCGLALFALKVGLDYAVAGAKDVTES